MFQTYKKSISWQGKDLTLSTGQVARQAAGAVWVEYGRTTVLCTVATQSLKEEGHFLPLTVVYQEPFSAGGKFPGGFLKREGKPSEREVLVSRLIDRAIRPLLGQNKCQEIQVVAQVLSCDVPADAEVAAFAGISAALALTPLTFEGPVAVLKLSDPSLEQGKETPFLDITLASTLQGIAMVEAQTAEMPEAEVMDLLHKGWEHTQPLLTLIQTFGQEAAPQGDIYIDQTQNAVDQGKEASHGAEDSPWDTLNFPFTTYAALPTKQKRNAYMQAWIAAEHTAHFSEYTLRDVEKAVQKKLTTWVRKNIIDHKTRLDGRALDQIRPIDIQTGLLPCTHGSALFTRGETQALVTTTLGASEEGQLVDGLEPSYKETFLLHYNFPPYAVGEVGRLGAPGRREIGHGKLAWRSLRAVLPAMGNYSYRVVSTITESNGSSSMATVCGGSLALMDAGVELRAPVAGIAMGLVYEQNQAYILSDITGDEDGLGDMDFKVAGTAQGLTSLQMDLKVTSLPLTVIHQALTQARQGLDFILNTMNDVLKTPRDKNLQNLPTHHSLAIPREKIRDLIGPGGRVIRDICTKTQAKIDVKDDGQVEIFAPDATALQNVLEKIQFICHQGNVGDVYEGVVVKILPSGAFVRLRDLVDGFLHISEVSHDHVSTIEDALTMNQAIKVKVIGFDRQGKMRLSLKDVT